MIKTFTHNDVIRYAYQETPEEDNTTIEQILLTDPEMQAFYQDVLVLRNQVNLIYMQPSEKVSNRILDYSAQFMKRS